jgi:hypothetical protein
MFSAGDGKWEPYKIREVKKATAPAPAPATNGDVEMGGTGEEKEDEEPEFEEDLESDEGAVYPLTSKLVAHKVGFHWERGLIGQKRGGSRICRRFWR